MLQCSDIREAKKMVEISRETIMLSLNQEAEKIRKLLTNQRNYQCISQCKAFEEVVDTQMFGFSKQIEFAQSIGLIDKQYGSQLIADLEQELNRVYSNVYQESKDVD